MPYTEYKGASLSVISLDTDKTIEGYNLYDEEVLGQSLKVYKVNKDSRFSIFYGKDILTGTETFYQYDTKTNTISVFDDELLKNLQEDNKLYMYIIMGAAGLILILLILLIVQLTKKGKKQKIKKEKKKKENKQEEKDFLK